MPWNTSRSGRRLRPGRRVRRSTSVAAVRTPPTARRRLPTASTESPHTPEYQSWRDPTTSKIILLGVQKRRLGPPPGRVHPPLGSTRRRSRWGVPGGGRSQPSGCRVPRMGRRDQLGWQEVGSGLKDEGRGARPWRSVTAHAARRPPPPVAWRRLGSNTARPPAWSSPNCPRTCATHHPSSRSTPSIAGTRRCLGPLPLAPLPTAHAARRRPRRTGTSPPPADGPSH